MNTVTITLSHEGNVYRATIRGLRVTVQCNMGTSWLPVPDADVGDALAAAIDAALAAALRARRVAK